MWHEIHTNEIIQRKAKLVQIRTGEEWPQDSWRSEVSKEPISGSAGGAYFLRFIEKATGRELWITNILKDSM